MAYYIKDRIDPFSAGVLPQDQFQPGVNGLLPDLLAVSAEMMLLTAYRLCVCIADKHRAHAVTEFVPIGTCKPGDGHRNVGIQRPACPLRHGFCHRGGNGAKPGQQFFRNPQQLMLHMVCIADDPPGIDRRRTGHRRDGAADPAAGEALRRGKPLSL